MKNLLLALCFWVPVTWLVASQQVLGSLLFIGAFLFVMLARPKYPG